MSISAAKRKSLPTEKFALPAQRKYPIDTAARTRNAAARLEQMKKRGMVSESEYSQAKARIARAAKRFGIESEYNSTDAAPPAPTDRRKRVPSTIHVRADLAVGGALHVRHMKDRAFWDVEGIKLSDADSKDDKPVWIQLAKQGAFAGHPAGPFRLDLKTFNEIIANFKATTNQAIPVDYEHASEQDPTQGNIALHGAPAQGWIRDMEIREGNLWGLVEWLPQAREQIRSGQYRFLSPAIRFESKHRVTGANIGARMTSAALTNEPFLDGMAPLAARDAAAGGAIVALKGGLDRPLHSPHEYMPQLKAALKLGPLSTYKECSDMLARVRECCMSVGMDGVHDGESMSDYTRPMRALVGAVPGMTGEELFDTMEDLIGHAIDQHVAEMHPGGAQMDDTDPGDGGDGDMTMAMTEAETKLMNDLKTEVETLKGKVTAAETRATEAEGAVKTKAFAVTLKDNETPAAALAREFGLTLKDGETFGQAVTRILEQNKVLLDEKVKREEADRIADVEVAIATYKDTKGLKDSDKEHLLSFHKSSPAAFVAMYPPVSPDQAHLLRAIVPPNPRETVTQEEIVVPTVNETIRRLMSEEKMSFADAQIEAPKIVRAAARRKQAADDAKKNGQ